MNRTVYPVMASGGMSIGSSEDVASGYPRHIPGFVGIRDEFLVYA